MKVLVAGGAGYIGSHICVELLQANHEVIVIDDFSNSKPEVLGYIKDITGKDVKFYEFNILDEKKTEEVFKENEIDAVIHCAAFKAVGESVEKPIEYYTNNLTTTLIVAKMMKKYNVNIGVLTVPINIAQEITDKMVSGGIKAVWNFTPFRIRVPEDIVVQNTSLYAHLAVMFNRLNVNQD